MHTRLPLLPALALIVTSCVAPVSYAVIPASPPRPQAPQPPSVPPVAVGEMPDTVRPGDWRYLTTNAGTSARFGVDANITTLAVDCAPDTKAVMLRILLPGPSAPSGPATLRASTASRSLPLSVIGAFGTAQLTARDPILDAIAFSRGRFRVELDGRGFGYPVRAELARVVEDCR